MAGKNEKNKENRDQYSINESLLQSYRRIFISSASFLLAVGIFASNQENLLLFYIIIGMNLLLILWGWVPIVKVRAKIVDYYKYYIYQDTEYNLEGFLETREVRNKAYQSVEEKGPWRLTRIKIDIVLPSMFVVVWLVLFFSDEASDVVKLVIIAFVLLSTLWHVGQELK